MYPSRRDVGERVSTVPARLRGLGLQVEWASLATADYAIGRTVLVERKSVRDLHGSLIAGRFWHQVGRFALERSSRTSCWKAPTSTQARSSRTRYAAAS